MPNTLSIDESTIVTLKPGDLLFSEGDEGDQAYYVQSGMIEVSRRVGSAEVIITTEREGGIVGEMALIDHKPRSATARAVEDTVLVAIPKDKFEAYVANSDPLIRSLLERFTTIIRGITAENVRLILGIR